MEAQAVIQALEDPEGFPKEHVFLAASRHREALTPRFIQLFERLADSDGNISDRTASLAFFAFHLLGEWGASEAFPAVLRFLGADPDIVDHVLGDAITSTLPRVALSLYDGDILPMTNLILSPGADEYVRWSLFRTSQLLAMYGRIDMEGFRQFLRDGPKLLAPRAENTVWNGWIDAIADLGMTELVPAAEDAIREGLAGDFYTLDDFESVLGDCTSKWNGDDWKDREQNQPWADTYGQLSSWNRSEDPEDLPDYGAQPAINIFRDLGRNDPCPCGSGRKFKKCHLGDEDELARLISGNRLKT